MPLVFEDLGIPYVVDYNLLQGAGNLALQSSIAGPAEPKLSTQFLCFSCTSHKLDNAGDSAQSREESSPTLLGEVGMPDLTTMGYAELLETYTAAHQIPPPQYSVGKVGLLQLWMAKVTVGEATYQGSQNLDRQLAHELAARTALFSLNALDSAWAPIPSMFKRASPHVAVGKEQSVCHAPPAQQSSTHSKENHTFQSPSALGVSSASPQKTSTVSPEQSCPPTDANPSDTINTMIDPLQSPSAILTEDQINGKYVGNLIEYLQKIGCSPPEFEYDEYRPSTSIPSAFTCTVIVQDRKFTTSERMKSKKEAKSLAARECLIELGVLIRTGNAAEIIQQLSDTAEQESKAPLSTVFGQINGANTPPPSSGPKSGVVKVKSWLESEIQAGNYVGKLCEFAQASGLNVPEFSLVPIPGSSPAQYLGTYLIGNRKVEGLVQIKDTKKVKQALARQALIEFGLLKDCVPYHIAVNPVPARAAAALERVRADIASIPMDPQIAQNIAAVDAMRTTFSAEVSSGQATHPLVETT
jgi:dsRNA-specific ribonuclease